VPNYNVDQYKKTNWFDPMHVFNAYLNYNQTFGKHSVGATAGVNYETKNSIAVIPVSQPDRICTTHRLE
jgi:hypothetical protein